tara:strand:- start:287 stop:403 length:117 start_codon:yes stop_codon:yes gene_type:complete
VTREVSYQKELVSLPEGFVDPFLNVMPIKNNQRENKDL